MADWHDHLPFNPDEHLQPQVSLEEMQNSILQNYNAAQNYYSARRKSFLDLLASKGISIENNFKKDIMQIVQNSWSKLAQAFQQTISAGQGTQYYQQQFPELAAEFPLDTQLLDNMFRSKETFYQQRGFVFEDFIYNHIFSKLLQTGQNFVNGHTNNLIALAVGSEVSKSGVVKGQKATRSDHLIALESMRFSNRDGIFQENSYKSGIPLELQGKLTLDLNDALPKSNMPMEVERLAKRLLGRTGMFYGFQAKTYSNLKDARWMNSSVMQGMINSVFNQTDSKGSRHTWENEYAGVYTTYFLSHQLMAIINPVNIGLVTGSNFYWMDDLLATRRFYMGVSMSESFGKHKRSNTRTGFPQIKNSTILFTNYASQTKGFKESAVQGKDGIIRVRLTGK